MILKNTGQVFYRMPDLPDVFLMWRRMVWVWERKPQKWSAFFNMYQEYMIAVQDVLSAWLITADANPDHLAGFYAIMLLSPLPPDLSILYSLEGCSLVQPTLKEGKLMFPPPEGGEDPMCFF